MSLSQASHRPLARESLDPRLGQLPLQIPVFRQGLDAPNQAVFGLLELPRSGLDIGQGVIQPRILGILLEAALEHPSRPVPVGPLLRHPGGDQHDLRTVGLQLLRDGDVLGRPVDAPCSRR